MRKILSIAIIEFLTYWKTTDDGVRRMPMKLFFMDASLFLEV